MSKFKKSDHGAKLGEITVCFLRAFPHFLDLKPFRTDLVAFQFWINFIAQHFFPEHLLKRQVLDEQEMLQRRKLRKRKFKLVRSQDLLKLVHHQSYLADLISDSIMDDTVISEYYQVDVFRNPDSRSEFGKMLKSIKMTISSELSTRATVLQWMREEDLEEEEEEEFEEEEEQDFKQPALDLQVKSPIVSNGKPWINEDKLEAIHEEHGRDEPWLKLEDPEELVKYIVIEDKQQEECFEMQPNREEFISDKDIEEMDKLDEELEEYLLKDENNLKKKEGDNYDMTAVKEFLNAESETSFNISSVIKNPDVTLGNEKEQLINDLTILDKQKERKVLTVVSIKSDIPMKKGQIGENNKESKNVQFQISVWNNKKRKRIETDQLSKEVPQITTDRNQPQELILNTMESCMEKFFCSPRVTDAFRNGFIRQYTVPWNPDKDGPKPTVEDLKKLDTLQFLETVIKRMELFTVF